MKPERKRTDPYLRRHVAMQPIAKSGLTGHAGDRLRPEDEWMDGLSE